MTSFITFIGKKNYKRFSDLDFKPFDEDGGIFSRLYFDNGYGVSVVKHNFSYGNELGLYELAVLAGNEKSSSLCYDTPITDDVLGHKTPSDISSIMRRVQNLPRRKV